MQTLCVRFVSLLQIVNCEHKVVINFLGADPTDPMDTIMRDIVRKHPNMQIDIIHHKDCFEYELRIIPEDKMDDVFVDALAQQLHARLRMRIPWTNFEVTVPKEMWTRFPRTIAIGQA